MSIAKAHSTQWYVTARSVLDGGIILRNVNRTNLLYLCGLQEHLNSGKVPYL